MIVRYLDESFRNPIAKDALIKLIRFALPSVKLTAVKLGDNCESGGIIVAEEYFTDSLRKLDGCRNILLLVTECFVQNIYTGRITRNVSSANVVGLLAHVLAFYLHLAMHFRIIGRLSRWDIFLLPLVPPFFAMYLYARIRRVRTNIRSLVEHEFMLAGLQYNFDMILPTVAGLVFSHPVIRETFNKFYPEQRKFAVTPNPVFDSKFQFKITGNQLSLISWYGYRNQWRVSRAKEIADQIRSSVGPEGEKIRVEYSFTSEDSPEMFHLVMRQSDTWPLSSSTKIRDILIAGKIPVLEYPFCDHPVCELALRVSDIISLYRSMGAQQVAIEKLEEDFRERIYLYNAWAIAENARQAANLIEFLESQRYAV